MNQLRSNFTRAEYIRNVFPTKTFPNHHSIATGVFPDKHGVMANTLYDFVLKAQLNYSYELYHFKSDIVPIWILNEMRGGVSGCMMWPGSNYEYDNLKCTWTHPFNNPPENYTDRVDEIFKWIKHDTKSPNLIMLYIEEPDFHAHAFGPNSQTITDLVMKLNNVTEHLHQKIIEHGMQERINVIHLSDHGMDELQLKNVIDLSKIVGDGKVNFYGSTPILQIVPHADSETEEIFRKLKVEADKQGTFKVYRNEDLPERWKFNNKDRVGKITAVADIGYGFQDMFALADWYEKFYHIPKTNTTKYGVHG